MYENRKCKVFYLKTANTFKFTLEVFFESNLGSYFALLRFYQKDCLNSKINRIILIPFIDVFILVKKKT